MNRIVSRLWAATSAFGFGLAWFFAAADVLPAAERPASPWPSDVPGFVAPAAGEHPRLFVRKSDLAALRAKAETREGRAIAARLRKLLDGAEGNAMPKQHRPEDAPYGDRSQPVELPEGSYTISHAAGYGLLYQLTGDRRYADLGRECFEWAWRGIRDRDAKGRYAWKDPQGALRAGVALGWYAVGYDLCYDGWDEAFRMKAAQAIQNYNEGPFKSLPELARGARHHPGSNHWGMQVGGAALALLAIKDDPGVDREKIAALLEQNTKCMIRNMTEGFGDGGFFAEGDGTGSMSSHIVFLPALQAWRTAGGKDFIAPRPNAQWMALRWFAQAVSRDGKADFWPQRGGYPHSIWARGDISGAGYFAIALGVVSPQAQAGVIGYYDRFFKAADEKAGTPFDTVSPYPHHAVLSLINWPVGLAGSDPAGAWPLAFHDSKYQFFLIRNRYRDEDDIVITHLGANARGFIRAPADRQIQIRALGKKFGWGRLPGKITAFETRDDGSTVVQTASDCFAVDFSGAAGLDALLALTGDHADRALPVGTAKIGGRTVSFLMLGKNKEQLPEVRVEGDRALIGEQTARLEQGRIVFGR